MVTNTDETLQVLQQGEISIQGEFMWGSNYTFLAEVRNGDQKLQVVYKPTRGERPLWDFPASNLAHRETAAYLVSEAIGWKFVPPTVYRRDGPIGAGSVQLFIQHDPEYHYFNFSTSDKQRLRPVVLFDLLINNADRKGSHVLLDEQGYLWLIDHGICFHVENKLRTVIWDFAGETIPEDLIIALHGFQTQFQPDCDLVKALQSHLSEAEIDALAARAGRILNVGRFPNPPNSRRHFPWPPV
jgi:uncharacterized repeat protein (TIGR03843 family)